MPQLMPLMWISSVLMFMLFMFMLINMYNYKEEFELDNLDLKIEFKNINLEW